jgi:hypothetical protein
MRIRQLLSCLHCQADPRVPEGVGTARSVQLLQDAVKRQRQVVAFHGKEWLVFRPHRVRQDADGARVFAYLLRGRPYLSTEPADVSPRWVWLPVAELWGLEARDAPRRAAAADG